MFLHNTLGLTSLEYIQATFVTIKIGTQNLEVIVLYSYNNIIIIVTVSVSAILLVGASLSEPI